MKIREIAATKTIKPETPEQARISSLKAGVDRARAALDAERKRQQVSRASLKLRQITSR